MAHPIDPSFGRHGDYSTGRTAVEAFRQGSFTTPTNMYHGNARQQPLNFWQKVTMRADSVRDAMGDKCCRCLHHMPSLVLIIGILVLIGLAIAAVPVAFVLISNSGGQADQLKADLPTGSGSFSNQIRSGFKVAGWPGYNEEIDKEEEKDELRAISAAALFPPNVSLCHGFGFACTSQPSMIISTSARCDGKADCADGSDELNCRECQTPVWCELKDAGAGEARERLCLRADQLCDGVRHCPDGVDETSFCRTTTEVCPENTRRCAGSPLCLPEESFCDGVTDCRNDEDEANCKECKRDAKMCKSTGRCIPRRELCDGVANCPDGSDEMECDCKGCSGSDRALCGNGRCLERSKVCDGTIDCEGGLDEKNCPGTCRDNNTFSTSSSSSATPSTVKTVVCEGGRQYPESEACSGRIRACSRSCSKCDATLAFSCSDGMCISKKMVCDGTPDCSGGEDEKGCEEICAASDAFKCKSGSKCVPRKAVCDGTGDCDDESDEKNCGKCPSSSFHCLADRRCLPLIARCDGVSDCVDGSDETDCSCRECTATHSDTYACEKTSHCFKRDSVCSPYSKCPNATHVDKLFCAAKALERSIF